MGFYRFGAQGGVKYYGAGAGPLAFEVRMVSLFLMHFLVRLRRVHTLSVAQLQGDLDSFGLFKVVLDEASGIMISVKSRMGVWADADPALQALVTDPRFAESLDLFRSAHEVLEPLYRRALAEKLEAEASLVQD